MAIFCIPQHLITTLKESALKGQIEIQKLYDMSSLERRDFFTKHTDKELGKFLNTEFEKAIVSNQKTAMLDWAKSVFSPKEQTKPVFQSILDKINRLDEIGILSPENQKAFLEDLIADRLGISVTAAEVKTIAEKAKAIDEAQIKLGEDLGNPEKTAENLAFFKAKKAMDDYLLSLTPASNLKIGTGTIGRGMMLASIKSPVLNIGSNIEVGFTEALSRRLASGQLRGADNGLAVDFVKMTNKIYQETGYDMSRMTSLKDTGASGERVLGQTVHSQGTGPVRAVGRVVEDIVFKQLMGAPDVAFSSAHFADSVNLNAMKLAKDGQKPSDIMRDAMRLEPLTPEGEILRAQGILDAQKATWTNQSWASDVSQGIRKILNDVTGDVRAGDYLLPFVKTPSNVIATGIDYAGFGIVSGLYKTVKVIRSGDFSADAIRPITRDMVRGGIGLTGAFVIASQLSDDDFVGAYDPSRAQIESLRNSNYNAIRIGGKWVSTDWLGPLAVPVTAQMYARKYGDTPGESTFQYGKGVVSSILNIPGISDIYDLVRSQAFKKNQTLEEMTGESSSYIVSELSSRLTPSILSDIAKAVDPLVRKSNNSWQRAITAKIPFLSKTLPPKTNIFGEPVTGEPAWSDILFGARVKTDKEDALISQIKDIADLTGKSVNFTDWDKSSSKTLAQFKEKVGVEKYDKAKVQYGEELRKQLTAAVKNPTYQRLSDEEKLTVINAQDAEAMNHVFKKYGFKYIQEKRKPTPKL